MRKTVGVGVVLTVGILACGDEMTDSAGDALRKAGKAIADAGEALVDAGSDASAQEDAGQVGLPKSETVELPCDERYQKTQTKDAPNPDGGKIEHSDIITANYYATIRLDTSGLVGADVIACEPEPVGTNTPTPECETGWSCAGQDRPSEPTRCVTLQAEIGAGFVRAQCGQWVKHAGYWARPPFESGQRYRTVRITVRR